MGTMRLIVLLALCFCLCYAEDLQQNKTRVFRQKLRKIESQKIKEIRESLLNHTTRWNKIGNILGSSNELNTLKSTIDNYADLVFVTRIGVGTPKQYFDVAVDIGFHFSWVTDKQCQDDHDCPDYCDGYMCRFKCPPECCNDDPSRTGGLTKAAKNPCNGKSKYDPQRSATHSTDTTSKNFALRYNPWGLVGGELARDTITIDSVAVAEAQFGRAHQLPDVLIDEPIDGVIGLAQKAIDATEAEKSVFAKAVESKAIKLPMFTLWLKSLGRGASGQVGGGLTFGGRDEQNCGGPLINVGVAYRGEDSWSFWVHGIKVNNERDSTRRLASPTTTNPAILVDPNNFKRLLAASGARFNRSLELYTAPCSAQFTFSIFLSDMELKIAAKEMLYQLETGGGDCALASALSSTEPDAALLLGLPFLRQRCAVFDSLSRRVGFTDLK